MTTTTAVAIMLVLFGFNPETQQVTAMPSGQFDNELACKAKALEFKAAAKAAGLDLTQLSWACVATHYKVRVSGVSKAGKAA